jgi:hypothetical protein
MLGNYSGSTSTACYLPYENLNQLYHSVTLIGKQSEKTSQILFTAATTLTREKPACKPYFPFQNQLRFPDQGRRPVGTKLAPFADRRGPHVRQLLNYSIPALFRASPAVEETF